MASTKRKHDANGQQTLFAVGVTRPDKAGAAENETILEESSPKVKYPRKFMADWLDKFKWLKFDNEKMVSTLCAKFKKDNVFTRGCTNFKSSSLYDHMKSQDHRLALQAPEHQRNREKCEDSHRSLEHGAVLVALKSMYWLAVENIPLSKFRSFINFQKSVGVDILSALSISPGITYDSDYAANEFLKALSDVVEVDTSEALENSPFVTVLVDESTDRTITHRLVIYCQVIDATTMQPATLYITNVQLDQGTGAAVSAAIYDEMSKRGVTADKIIGLGTDGASAMTGRNKGTTGMMLRQNPHLVNVHCIAHRLALCTSQAAENIPAMKLYQDTITSIFYYFKYSTCRVARLKEIQQVLESPQLKFKEVHSVRWMSFFLALETVHRCLDPLLTYLATAEHSDAKAQGLKKKIGTLKFISLTYMLMDVIPIVTKLNLFFQKETTDVALVKVKITETLTELRAILVTDGHHQLSLQPKLHDGSYNEHHITGCPASEITSVKEKFINNLIKNIEKRFPDTDLLSSFGILSMRPITFLSSDDLDEWGNEQLEVLINHFGKEQTHTWKEETDQSKTSPALIDADSTRKEWKQLKTVVKVQMYPRDSLFILWKLIDQFHREEFPNLIKLACLAITCPINTAGCERGFSVQNQTLTSTRNRLTPEHQDMIFRLRIHSGHYNTNNEFPYERAFRSWKSAVDRKISA